MRCRHCGCTDMRACPGGCYWAAPEVCSACEPRTAAPQRAPLTGLVDLQVGARGTGRPAALALHTPAAAAARPDAIAGTAARADDRPPELATGRKIDRVVAALRRGHKNSRAIADATWLTTAEVGAFLCQLHSRHRVTRTAPIQYGPGKGSQGRPMRDYTLIEEAVDA